MITEPMRREQAIAVSILRCQGKDYALVSNEERKAAHTIARHAIPGVDFLIERAVTSAMLEAREAHALEEREAARKAYIDGFDDGERSKYLNRWEDNAKSYQGEIWPVAV